MSTPGDQDEGVTPAQSESVPSSIQPSLNLTVAGDIVSTYSEGRKHSEVFLKGQDGYVHYFYVENNTWLHDGQSFKVAGRVDSLAAVYERGGRSSSALFVKGEDGFLTFTFSTEHGLTMQRALEPPEEYRRQFQQYMKSKERARLYL
jgi:hypothetical protein